MGKPSRNAKRKVVQPVATVEYNKTLQKTITHKPTRKKNDMLVDAFCARVPLSLPQGVEIHRVFMDKGELMQSDMAKLFMANHSSTDHPFSKSLPYRGLSSLKSIMYGHVLNTKGRNGATEANPLGRHDMFLNHDNESIWSVPNEIVGMIDDPFWQGVETKQKFGNYEETGYAPMVDSISKQYATHNIQEVPEWVSVGIQRAVNELEDGITPISLEESIGYCLTDTNAGFPCFTSVPFISVREDGSSYDILNREVYDTYRAIAEGVWENKAHKNLPAAVFKRIQPGSGTQSKVRIVECVSRGVLWAEARIWRPILEAMRKLPAYAGYMHWDVGTQDVVTDALEREHVSSLDYSSFDALIGPMLPILFEALAVKIPQAAPLFEYFAEYSRECPLITPHGWLQGRHGLFSGMFCTSFGGSLINRGLILGLEWLINSNPDQYGSSIDDIVHMGFGDDTILCWNGNITMRQILDILESAGMELNESKQEYCPPGSPERFVMFQAKYWRWHPGHSDHCVPVYPLTRLSARLAFREEVDAHTALIYAARLSHLDVVCDGVTGPFLSAFIAKICEGANHPYLERYITRYQKEWIHYLNPMLCVSNEAGKAYIKTLFGFDPEDDESSFLALPVCEMLINNISNLPEYDITSLRMSESDLNERARKAMERRQAARALALASEDGDRPKITDDDLVEEISNSGLSDLLVNSVLISLGRTSML